MSIIKDPLNSYNSFPQKLGLAGISQIRLITLEPLGCLEP